MKRKRLLELAGLEAEDDLNGDEVEQDVDAERDDENGGDVLSQIKELVLSSKAKKDPSGVLAQVAQLVQNDNGDEDAELDDNEVDMSEPGAKVPKDI